jgi:hypothetical protein
VNVKQSYSPGVECGGFGGSLVMRHLVSRIRSPRAVLKNQSIQASGPPHYCPAGASESAGQGLHRPDPGRDGLRICCPPARIDFMRHSGTRARSLPASFPKTSLCQAGRANSHSRQAERFGVAQRDSPLAGQGWTPALRSNRWLNPKTRQQPANGRGAHYHELLQLKYSTLAGEFTQFVRTFALASC